MLKRRLAKLLFAVIAVLTVAGAIYAHGTGDPQMRTTSYVALVLLVPLAAFFGIFRIEGRKPKGKPARPEPATDDDYLTLAGQEGITTGDAFRLQAKSLARVNNLTLPNRETVKRLSQEIDRQRAKADAFVRTGEVTLLRLPHGRTDVTKDGNSWLGGAPALGAVEWPLGADGLPLHHLAHIRLDSLPGTDLPEGLPRMGALSFFIQTTGTSLGEGRVVYVPQPTQQPTTPPKQLPLLYDGPNWTEYIKGETRQSAPRVFPRWPVGPLAIPVADPDSSAMANAYLSSKFPNQNTMAISVRRYLTTVPAFAGPYYWDTAQRFANSLILAAEHNDTSEDFAAFVDEVTGWAFEYDAWEGLMRAEVDLLLHYFGQVQPQGNIPALHAASYQGSPGEITDLATLTDASFMAAATGDYTTFIALPDVVRSDIDAHWLLPSNSKRHQMFGFGSKGEATAQEHAHDHLLLQLHADQLHQWHWGAGNVVQFWISQEALAAQDWSAAKMTIDRC